MQVGNTPLIKLSDKLYGKLESINPGGSIKDRPVKYILDRMDLKKGEDVAKLHDIVANELKLSNKQ